MRQLMWLPLALGAVWAAGCGGGSGPVPVEGTVKVAGQPMGVGTVVLTPADGGDRQSTGQVLNGAFQIPQKFGPAPGKYKVQVRWDKPTGKTLENKEEGTKSPEYAEGLPERYNLKTELTTDVAAGGPHKLDLDLAVTAADKPAAPAPTSAPVYKD